MADRNEETKTVWDLMQKVGFCMLVTKEGEKLRSRPMAAHADPDEHAIYFLTDAASHKDEDIKANPDVNLAFADNSAMNYVSLSGRAEITNDRKKIADLWSTPAKAWWDDKDDPSIRVLKVTPDDAHYWNSPSKPVAYFKMAMAAMSDSKPDMGDTGQVKL